MMIVGWIVVGAFIAGGLVLVWCAVEAVLEGLRRVNEDVAAERAWIASCRECGGS